MARHRSNAFMAPLGALIARMRGSMLISGAAVSMAVRVAGMAIGFGSHILLSRLLGASDYGSYVIALGWVMILAVVARLGLDNVALRFATNYREEGRASDFRGFKRFSLLSILAVSCLIAMVGFAAKLLGLPWLDNVSFAMLAWTASLTAALAFLGWYAVLLRTAHQIFLAQAYEQLLRPALLVAAVGLVLLAGIKLSATGAMALTFATALAALVGIVLHSRRYFVAMRGDDMLFTEGREWLAMGWVLLMMAICQEAVNQFEIILLGLLARSTDAAHFSAPARLASFVPFALAAIVSVSGPMIASAHRRSDQAALARIAKISARFALIFAVAIAVVLIVFGRWMLAALGPSFVVAYPALLVLLIGGLVNAATGAVGYFLALTANHVTALRILLGALILSLVANAILIPSLGIMGGAIASTAVVSYWNLAMIWSVRRRLGIDASAIGLSPRRPETQT